MTTEQSAVQTFLAWLARDVPSVHASLAPPASATSLEALVQTCGALPDPFLELYRAHDGQAGEDIHFVPYHYLASVEEVVATWKDQQTYEDSFEWRPEWIPFARFDCDYLCLDAKTGQVLVFFLKFPDRPVIAKSFGELLAHIQTSVETARFVVTEDGITDDTDPELAWTAVWERECAAARASATSGRRTKSARRDSKGKK